MRWCFLVKSFRRVKLNHALILPVQSVSQPSQCLTQQGLWLAVTLASSSTLLTGYEAIPLPKQILDPDHVLKLFFGCGKLMGFNTTKNLVREQLNQSEDLLGVIHIN